MDGEAGWWTTSGNIGLPPLARVMGVGRQQQQGVVAVNAECEYMGGTPDPGSRMVGWCLVCVNCESCFICGDGKSSYRCIVLGGYLRILGALSVQFCCSLSISAS